MRGGDPAAGERERTMATLEVDLCVVGGGSAGLSVAAGASQMGATTVLIEAGKMGGDCLNYGCVPSKAMLAAGHAAHGVRHAGRFGVNGHEPNIDFGRVHDHIQGVIGAIAPLDSQERFEGLGVTVLRDHASFCGPRGDRGGRHPGARAPLRDRHRQQTGGAADPGPRHRVPTSPTRPSSTNARPPPT